MTPKEVIVGTERSPGGRAIPIDWVRTAFDRLTHGEEVRISVPSLGYRSAFVGAAMLSLPNAKLLTNPTRVQLVR